MPRLWSTRVGELAGGLAMQAVWPASNQDEAAADAACTGGSTLVQVLLHPNVFAPRAGTTRTSSSGCDSSDCLFCQYRASTATNGSTHALPAHAGRQLGSLLRKRSTSHNGELVLGPTGLSDLDLYLASTSSLLAEQGAQQPGAKRPRRSFLGGGSGLPPVLFSDGHQQQQQHCSLGSPAEVHEGASSAETAVPPDTFPGHAHEHVRAGLDEPAACRPCDLHSSRGWRFRAEWSGGEDPAPAQLCELFSLGSGRETGEHAASSYRASAASDIVCALEFSPDGQLLAAGGMAKQVRLYNLAELLDASSCPWDSSAQHGPAPPTTDATAVTAPGSPPRGSIVATRSAREGPAADAGGHDPFASALATVHRLPSKISCMAWSPHQDGVMTIGDYDGVLLQLHVASGHQLADIDQHGGRKIWSVAHSQRVPHLAASAGDDCIVRLWAGRGLAECAATLCPGPRPSSLCSVDFSAVQDHLMAVASSDRSLYLYDLRALACPLATLRHHSRPLSYVRFFGAHRMVSASIDGSMALWDISAAGGCLSAATAGVHPGAPVPQQLFRGHRNEKNFVGLSVQAGRGLVACGSETSHAYVYHTSWSAPLASADVLSSRMGAANFPGQGQACGIQGGDAVRGGACGFVSAVCWQPEAAGSALGLPPVLATATSQGGIRVSALMA